MIKTEITHYL